jgi:hypothetical protein
MLGRGPGALRITSDSTATILPPKPVQALILELGKLAP